jgi:hypothetical protein
MFFDDSWSRTHRINYWASKGPFRYSAAFLFKHCRFFLRTLRVTRDNNLAVCLPFGNVYPLSFSVSGDRGNLFLPGFMLTISSSHQSSGVYISLNACTSSVNWSGGVEESRVWRTRCGYGTRYPSTSSPTCLVFSLKWRRLVIACLFSWMFFFCAWISYELLHFGLGIDGYLIEKREFLIWFIWIRGAFHQNRLSVGLLWTMGTFIEF